MLDERLSALYKKIDEMEASEEWVALADVYKECIQISLSVYGEYHDETLALYSEDGGLLRNLGRYEESLEILRRALHCAGVLKGKEHLDYAAALVNLANLLRMMKYFHESETLFLEAKKIYERKNGSKLFQYAGLCNNLGLLYQNMERYENSIPLHLLSLDILKNDTTHEILYGVTLNNLVEPYKHTGQKEKAILCLNKAISIFEKHLEHASVLYAAAMNNLGIIYYEDKYFRRAKECFETALAISSKKLGKESESYLYSLQNYKRACAHLQSTIIESTVPTSGQEAQETEVKFSSLSAADLSASVLQSVTKKNHSIQKDSKGLDIAEAYFFDVCYPMLKKEFREYLPRMAAGLVGEGSECFGFDDAVSRDHDFGPAFQIFIPKKDWNIYGNRLAGRIQQLPKKYGCFESRSTSPLGAGRTGVLTIEDFYEKFLSIHEIPDNLNLWLQLDDIPLSTATNGRIFMDNLGEFTRIREGLLKHYPKDVWLKRLAFYCTQIAQSGQYNLLRCLKRGHFVSAFRALNEFVTSYISLIYLINKTYKPYYKWEHEGLKNLPILGKSTYDSINGLVLISLKENGKYAVFETEQLCQKAIEFLQKRNLTDSQSDFLLDHCPSILSRASDERIRHSDPWARF